MPDYMMTCVRGDGVVELPRIVVKPWGREVWWALTERYCGKIIEVRAGECTSRQYHTVKHETLYVLHGQVSFEMSGKKVEVGPGFRVELAPNTVHRIAGVTDAVLCEVSTPETDDVVRLEDQYGRAPMA